MAFAAGGELVSILSGISASRAFASGYPPDKLNSYALFKEWLVQRIVSSFSR